MYRLATASPGHREHVALQRQPFASAWPRCHIAILHSIHLEGFTTCAKHGPSGHKTPVWAFTALPLPSQVTANTLPCSGNPLPAPGHVAILHLEGFKTCAKHGPSRHKIRLWAFTALPLPSQVTAHTLPCSGSPLPAPGHVAILHVEGFKTCAKHRPSRHKTRLSAFTALPLPSQVTAHTLPCSGSPVPVPGHVAIIHVPPCHCFPRSPRTRCPAAAALCQRLATLPYRHTPLHPFRGFHNLREARAIRTQNPRVGLYRFATAFPGHREYVALQRQPFASAWLVAILHVEGFKTCAKHRPSRHKTRLSAFTALPLPSQVTAHTLTCSGSPVPVPGHVAIIHVPPCHCFPRSPRTRCPAAAALCQRLATLPYRHTPLHPFRGFHNLREARAIRTQNPRVGLYRFATAFPGHREHVALQRQPFASAWPCRHTPFRGFQNVREARPITTQNPSVGLYRFATAFPGHRTHVALQRQPFASAWPCRHTPCRGIQNVREAPPITTQNPSVGLLCRCLPRSPHTRCPAAAALCQCLAMSP